MKSEKIVEKYTTYGLNVSGGEIDSLRVQNSLKTVIRVYEDGKIGVAGRIGEGDDNALLEQAKAQLAQNIEYPCDLTVGAKREENHSKVIVKVEEYVKTMKKLLARLNKEYPDFIFSNKINMGDSCDTYENSEGTFFKHESSGFGLGLVLQDKNASNIMDLFYVVSTTTYNEDKIVEEIGKLVSVFHKRVELDETLPVMIDGSLLGNALGHFSADLYMSGASLLKDKLNTKIFDEKVNLVLDRGRRKDKESINFFDAEGVVNKDDKFYLVKNGVMCGLATCKRTAKKYNLPISGSAAADYDSVPSASFAGFTIEKTANKVSDLVKGKAIYVYVASGGDMTTDGTFGIPVQVAYLYDNGKLVGRLPEFSLNANIFDLLGKDFIGYATNDVFPYADDEVLVGKFTVNKN